MSLKYDPTPVWNESKIPPCEMSPKSLHVKWVENPSVWNEAKIWSYPTCEMRLKYDTTPRVKWG